MFRILQNIQYVLDYNENIQYKRQKSNIKIIPIWYKIRFKKNHFCAGKKTSQNLTDSNWLIFLLHILIGMGDPKWNMLIIYYYQLRVQ